MFKQNYGVKTDYGLLHELTNWKTVLIKILFLSGCPRSLSHSHTDECSPCPNIEKKKLCKHTILKEFSKVLLEVYLTQQQQRSRPRETKYPLWDLVQGWPIPAFILTPIIAKSRFLYFCVSRFSLISGEKLSKSSQTRFLRCSVISWLLPDVGHFYSQHVVIYGCYN